MPGVSLYDIPSGGRGPIQPPIFGPSVGGVSGMSPTKGTDPMAQVMQSLMMAQLVQNLKKNSSGGGGGGLLGGLLGGKGGGGGGSPVIGGGDPTGEMGGIFGP